MAISVRPPVSRSSTGRTASPAVLTLFAPMASRTSRSISTFSAAPILRAVISRKPPPRCTRLATASSTSAGDLSARLADGMLCIIARLLDKQLHRSDRWIGLGADAVAAVPVRQQPPAVAGRRHHRSLLGGERDNQLVAVHAKTGRQSDR